MVSVVFRFVVAGKIEVCKSDAEPGQRCLVCMHAFNAKGVISPPLASLNRIATFIWLIFPTTLMKDLGTVGVAY